MAVTSNESKETEQRLIVISNRLPITIKKEETFSFSMSSGGLVSALSGLKKEMSFSWIGWPGKDFDEKDRITISKTLKEDYNCKPVFLSEDLADAHYNGFSNSILWPLFHYHPGEISFNDESWSAYKEANQKFADVVFEELQDGDMVWVHDYHLMMLPQMLRKLMGGSFPNVKIGWFLHTPFPSSEIYRVLPVRSEVLLGVLDSDLIGFHTYDYARHFLSSCSLVLSLETFPNSISYLGRKVKVGTFPIGIDPEKFVEELESKTVIERVNRLKEKFKGFQVIVGVDRLDYIKGVPQKLAGYEYFFEKYPEFIGKVVLVQVAVPTRSDVAEYQYLTSRVNEQVGRINGRFGTVEYVPIHFMYQSVNFQELVALYAISDVCLVSSTRDGMNLVSYEYISTQQQKHGTLILSEFAGAAQSLNGSLIINPWDTEDVADTIHTALTLTPEARKENFQKLFRYVNKYTAAYWGMNFVRELEA